MMNRTIPPMPRYGEPENTEEDLIRVLRRTPFDEMRAIVQKYYRDSRDVGVSMGVIMILGRHGWKYEEYEKEMMKYFRTYGLMP